MRYRFIANSLFMTAVVVVFTLGGWVVAQRETPVYRSSVTVQVVLQPRSTDTSESVAQGAHLTAHDLALSVPTSDFLAAVLQSGYRVNDQRLIDATSQSNWWKSMVHTEREASHVAIQILHPSKQDARALISAVMQTLITQHSRWHSRGITGTVAVVEQPIVSGTPFRPSAFMTVVGGLLLGLLLSGGWLVGELLLRRSRFAGQRREELTIDTERVFIHKKPPTTDVGVTQDVPQKDAPPAYPVDTPLEPAQEPSEPEYIPSIPPSPQSGILPMVDPHQPPERISPLEGLEPESVEVQSFRVGDVSQDKEREGRFYYMGERIDA